MDPTLRDTTITDFIFYPKHIVIPNNVDISTVDGSSCRKVQGDALDQPNLSRRILLHHGPKTPLRCRQDRLHCNDQHSFKTRPTRYLLLATGITNFPTNQSITPNLAGVAEYKGKGETIVLTGTGLDIGSSTDVHHTFQRRVLDFGDPTLPYRPNQKALKLRTSINTKKLVVTIGYTDFPSAQLADLVSLSISLLDG